jgi:hypothetical protein
LAMVAVIGRTGLSTSEGYQRCNGGCRMRPSGPAASSASVIAEMANWFGRNAGPSPIVIDDYRRIEQTADWFSRGESIGNRVRVQIDS